MNTEDTFSAEYMTIETTKDGEIWTITGEGELQEQEDKWNKGKMKTVLNLPVRCVDQKLIYTPWPKEGRQFQKAWGKDSKSWVDKQFQILHIDKKMVVRPINDTKT